MRYLKTSLILCSLLSGPALADSLTLKSTDIAQGELMSKAQEFQGFGCQGGNMSPELSWSGAPADTKAFAVFAFDPDAPTGGSGWWHWQVVNIPATTTSLAAGAGEPGNTKLPSGTVQISNDYGVKGFGGACPPPGHGVHHYKFTVYALSQMLELPEGASSALVGYMVNAYALDSTTIEALYKRD